MRRRVVCPRSHPASLYVWGLEDPRPWARSTNPGGDPPEPPTQRPLGTQPPRDPRNPPKRPLASRPPRDPRSPHQAAVGYADFPLCFQGPAALCFQRLSCFAEFARSMAYARFARPGPLEAGMGMRFNPPPGWPPAPEGWAPGPGWQPDPWWPPAPP